MAHEEKQDWQFFRDKAQTCSGRTWKPEYRAELKGIAEGATARGVKLDLWDIVALNAWLELPYYDKWDAKQHGLPSAPAPPTIAAPSWPPAATPRTAAW